MLKPSPNVISLVKLSEGFSSKPYRCPAGIPTIGYGTTHYPSGVEVSMQDSSITEAQAIEYCLHELQADADTVNKFVKVTVNQNQFDALVDFVYNAGAGAFKQSTLLKLINQCNFALAAYEFDKWIFGHDPKTGGSIRLKGLVTRRNAEKNLFLKPI